METRAALADFDAATGRWTLYANTQGGWLVKALMAPLFGADPEKFRIITPDVGGGFGMKLFLYAEHVMTCYAARKLGHPVKWVSDRSEAFLADTQGRDNVTLGELAIDAGGKFLALRTRNISSMGAYLSNFAPFIPTFAGTGVLSSIYGFQAIYANVLGVFTNTVPVDAYRGAGRPEANYLVERLVDAAARELKIDRAEHGAAERDAALHPGRQIVRQRRFPQGVRYRAERGGLCRLPGPARGSGEARHAARHWLRVLPGSDRRRSDRAGGDTVRR
jgi:carbon-monoxide dehydrogenase large subunit